MTVKGITVNAKTGKVENTTSEVPEVNLDNLKALKIVCIKSMAGTILTRTDWRVLRHRDQVAGHTTTTITETEYQALLQSRQAVRDKSSELEDRIDACMTVEDVEAVDINVEMKEVADG